MEEQDFIPFDFADEYFQESPKKEKETEAIFQSKDILLTIPLPPWVDEDKKYPRDLLDLLHEEIYDFVDYISPTHAEHTLRQMTVDRIQTVVQSIWPEAFVDVFGSYDTHLYLPSRYFF